MYFSKPGRRWAAVIAGVSAAASQAQGFEPADLLGFTAGPLLLRPRVGLEEKYNDNIFYQPSHLGPTGDLITTINPGISISLGREEIKSAVDYTPLGVVTEEQPNFIAFDYSLASHFYAQQDNLNTTEHFFTIKDRLKGQRLKLEGSDSIQFLSGIIGQGFNLGNAIIDQTVFADNYKLSYAISEKTSAYAVASYSAQDFAPGTPLYSINTLQGTLGFSAQLLPKTSFFGELYYGQTAVRPNSPDRVAFPDGPYADITGGFIGVLGHFTEKLSGSVKAGYEVQSFSDNSPGESAPVVEAALSQRFSEKTSLSLIYTRHAFVSVQQIAIGFTSDSVGLKLDQVIGETGRLAASLAVNYQAFEYENTGVFALRHDDFYRASANLNYKFNLWMTGSLGYEFEKFDSNYLPSLIDYHANRVTLRLIVGY
ncbi:MAG: outer membrane beta-barrel protein [Limisphaerales bacterium]